MAATRALRSDWALGALAGWDEDDARTLSDLLDRLVDRPRDRRHAARTGAGRRAHAAMTTATPPLRENSRRTVSSTIQRPDTVGTARRRRRRSRSRGR